MKKTNLLSAILLSVCVGFSPTSALGQKIVRKQLSPREIAKQSLPSTVTILMTNSDTGETKSGSGFFVGNDLVVTNFHVISESTEGYAKVYGQQKAYQISGIVSVDEKNDLVVLKVLGVKGKPLKLNTNDSTAVGDEIFAVGNPKGLEGTFSEGIVSSIRREEKNNVLQITAPISAGSSGGPIINVRGEVVGVAVGAIEGGQSLNFAVPVFAVRAVLKRLESPEPIGKYNVVAGTIRKNRAGIELAYIPPGEFMMGSDDASPFNYSSPRHKVTIRYGFWIGKYEVTQRQWQSIMGTTIRNQSDEEGANGPVIDQGANYPMYYVSWDEAQEFIKRLYSESDDFIYRLPSEAEWEYVARTGTAQNRPDNLDEIAWYANNSGRIKLDASYLFKNDRKNYEKRIRDNGGHTYPTGTKKPNRLAIYDMFGNVSEWCEDIWTESYDGLPSDGSANVTKGRSSYRITRGGSWLDSEEDVSLVGRGGYCGWCRNNYIGFRIVAISKKRARVP